MNAYVGLFAISYILCTHSAMGASLDNGSQKIQVAEKRRSQTNVRVPAERDVPVASAPAPVVRASSFSQAEVDEQLRERQIALLRINIERNRNIFDLLRLRRNIEDKRVSERISRNAIKYIEAPLDIAPPPERLDLSRAIVDIKLSSELAEAYASYYVSRLKVTGYCKDAIECQSAAVIACRLLRGYEGRAVITSSERDREQVDAPVAEHVHSQCK